MKKSTKVALGIGIVVVAGLLLTSCNSFCTNEDLSQYRYAYDPINTTYFETEEQAKDYIVDSVNATEELDENDETLTFSDLYVYVYNEEEDENILTKIEDTDLDCVIKQYNDQLYYLVPNNIYYNYTYYDEDEEASITEQSHITIGISSFTADLLNSAVSSGIYIPSFDFFERLDQLTLEKLIEASNNCGYYWLEDLELTPENITFKDIYGYTYEDFMDYVNDETDEKLDELLGEDDGYGNPTRTIEEAETKGWGRNYSLTTTLGYLKFEDTSVTDSEEEDDDDDYDAYAQISEWNDLIASEIGFDQAMGSSYFDLYQTTLDSNVSSLKTCITVEDGFYGHISSDPLSNTVRIEAKGSNFWSGWKNAFTEHGFFEGLLVYPIATLIENLSHAMGMNGTGQILAVIIVTFIVRILFMLVTLPSTLSQQRMSALQPELAKLQQKYPNFDTNEYEKSRYAEAQMALYKKYKIHPWWSLITLLIQFPLFICVWNAMQGSASLSRDAFLGLVLSDTIWNTLTDVSGWPSSPGWWTALVLIILMSAAQIIAMLLPNWLSKYRNKKVQKLNAVPSQDTTAKTMKYVQWFMTIIVIIMGFTLPSAMGVYWLCGAIFSIIQTVILHFVALHMSKNMGKKKQKR